MKKFYSIILVLSVLCHANAQLKKGKIRFGFSSDLNYSTMRFNIPDYIQTAKFNYKIAPSASIFLNIAVNDELSFQSEISYISKKLDQRHYNNFYISFFEKYRVSNSKFSILFGPQIGYVSSAGFKDFEYRGVLCTQYNLSNNIFLSVNYQYGLNNISEESHLKIRTTTTGFKLGLLF